MQNLRQTALLLSLLAAACGDDGGGGPGSLRVDLVPEQTITEGIPVQGRPAPGKSTGHSTTRSATPSTWSRSGRCS